MPLTISWEQIALRVLLAAIGSLLIGLNRDDRGHPAGMRTTMLVCLAACLAQLQANMMLGTAGKNPSSFAVLDLERLPLGILSGIGFIGAGVIVKKANHIVTGVTTAATIWFVSVLGLLFGGGQLILGCVATCLALVILWALRLVENAIPLRHSGRLHLELQPEGPTEEQIRERLQEAGFEFGDWTSTYAGQASLASLDCTVRWRDPASRIPHTPQAIESLGRLQGVILVSWSE